MLSRRLQRILAKKKKFQSGVKEDLVVPGCCVPFECEGRPAELGGCFVHWGTVLTKEIFFKDPFTPPPSGFANRATVLPWVVRFHGPVDWAQSAHTFSACERDRGVCHVLNTKALVVAFMLPLFWVVVCMRAACRTLGGHANVDSGKATASYVAFRSQRRATSCSQPLCVFKKVWPNKAAVRSARPRELAAVFCWAIRRLGGHFGVISP
ncbi:hypothetical protein Taro_038957 [Colocasia esculenta]|uniref:Uncharacterized protein n=1 Tax=Colocasia esculenta TaxID=4460 RepID=A0A843WEB5_COLES|nr:hypothetical protein [Colocasia esculenta]